MHQRRARDDFVDVPAYTVFAVTGIGEVVGAIDAARVRQEVTDRDAGRRVGIGETEPGQMRNHGIVDANLAARDVLEDERRDEDLRDRTDLEPRFDVDRRR
jgi:hypothetical protein